MNGRWIWGCALSVALGGGCFYDSRWHQETASQERQAAHLTPEAPRTEGGENRWRATRPLRVRAWASLAYRAEVQGWQAHVEQLFERANEVLGPATGSQLVLLDARAWDDAGSDSLADQLASLEQRDPGEDVDLVIGLVGSTPRLSASFETLGIARVLGRHLVMRAMNDAAESDAIREAFDRLSAAERDRLRRRRKAHKELAVLLHEIGHAYGAIHVRDRSALMNAEYDENMRAFASETLALVRPTMAERRKPESDRDDRALLEALTEALRAGRDAYVPEERGALLTRYEQMLQEGGAPPQASAPTTRDDRVGTLWEVSGLEAPDRAVFHETREAVQARRLAGAWERLSPLVTRYPDTYAVHELACELYNHGAAPREASRSCQRMMDLATSYGRD